MSRPVPAAERARGCGRRARQLLEAGERLVELAGLEPLDPRRLPVGAGAEEMHDRSLEAGAARPDSALDHRAHEEHVGTSPEHLVVVDREVLAHLDQAPVPAHELLGSGQRAEPERPVVREDEVGREDGGVVGLERNQQGRGRARTDCRALARRTAGKGLGIALVHAHDRIAQPVDGEELGARAAPAARRPRSGCSRPSRSRR